jgi:hypothetical protein
MNRFLVLGCIFYASVCYAGFEDNFTQDSYLRVWDDILVEKYAMARFRLCHIIPNSLEEQRHQSLVHLFITLAERGDITDEEIDRIIDDLDEDDE